MIVTAQRSGGIGGWEERLGPVDTEKTAAGAQIVDAVRKADFFNLPASYPPKQVIYDGYAYSLTVRADEGQAHTVRWEDGSEPPASLNAILVSMRDAADWERK
jgi:hypothetical protein